MAWFRKKSRPAGLTPLDGGLTRKQALALCPVKNSFVDVETNEDGFVRLVYPVTVKPWFSGPAKRLGLWKNRTFSKKVDLDELGSRAWSLMDGEHTVNDMVAVFAKRFGLQKREAEIALTAFLKELGKRGVIAFHEKT